jgi:hypothetical protein
MQTFCFGISRSDIQAATQGPASIMPNAIISVDPIPPKISYCDAGRGAANAFNFRSGMAGSLALSRPPFRASAGPYAQYLNLTENTRQ